MTEDGAMAAVNRVREVLAQRHPKARRCQKCGKKLRRDQLDYCDKCAVGRVHRDTRQPRG